MFSLSKTLLIALALALSALAFAARLAFTPAPTPRVPLSLAQPGQPPVQRPSTSEVIKQQALDAYGKLPLTFVANAGQVNRRVRYYGQGPGFGFYLTPGAMVFAFTQRMPGGEAGRAADLRTVASAPEEPGTRGVALALEFVGSDPQVALEGQERAPGTVNYLIGNDPAQWHSGLAAYEQVVYRALWPGVDLRVRGQGGELKYEFVVQPGARVADIRLAYRGSDGLAIDAEGNLLIDTPLGVLRDSRPISYQRIGTRRVEVESRYVLQEHAGRAGYGFALGTGYDPDHALVIDPGLAYSTFLGGEVEDVGTDVAVDADGNAYVTGYTLYFDFPTTPGAFDTTFNGGVFFGDVFVSKLDATGSTLVYSTFLGGVDDEVGAAVAVDAAGNAYVTGFTLSFNFPTTRGAFNRTRSGVDVFVSKLDASGSALVYSTFLGEGHGRGLAVDATGKAYVTGVTPSADFPTTSGAFNTTYNGGFSDAFVSKLNGKGSALVYSTYIGGSGFGREDRANDIAVDSAGGAYIMGGTTSSDFPTTPGAFDTTPPSGGLGIDVFVTKLNAAGSALAYSTFLGPGVGLGLAIDATGQAYVTGTTGFGSADFPTTPGAFDTTPPKFKGPFVSKLNPAGSALVYSTYLGSDGSDCCGGVSDLALDAAGNAYVTGVTFAKNFPTTPGALDRTYNGEGDAYLSKLNGAGSALVYSTFLGGTGSELDRLAFGLSGGVAVDEAGDAYVTGFTRSRDFPTTDGAFDTTLNESAVFGDAFVTKLELSCGGRPVTLFGTEGDDILTGTAGDDVIAGLGGNDWIDGRGGNDVICGGDGNDTLLGSSGDDKLIGEGGDDHLFGASGNDMLHGNAGNDRLNGEGDNDHLRGGDGNDFMLGGNGFDRCEGQGGLTDTAFGCERVSGVP